MTPPYFLIVQSGAFSPSVGATRRAVLLLAAALVLVMIAPSCSTDGATREAVICAEPSPEALSQFTPMETEFSKRGPDSVASNALPAKVEKTIQSIRDQMFNNCEAYANGAISKDRFFEGAKTSQRVLLALLAAKSLSSDRADSNYQPAAGGPTPENPLTRPHSREAFVRSRLIYAVRLSNEAADSLRSASTVDGCIDEQFVRNEGFAGSGANRGTVGELAQPRKLTSGSHNAARCQPIESLYLAERRTARLTREVLLALSDGIN
jgi:hypothetical protein